MPWFFENDVQGDLHIITGENARHIIKSLRMTVGEELTICDNSKMEYSCTISNITADSVCVAIDEKKLCENEPTAQVYLFQALTKGDKMDYIVQKAVELGVTTIVPVLTNRCVSRPDQKACIKKLARWQKIAFEAAKQSRRGIVPTVEKVINLKEATEICKKLESSVVFYECGGKDTGQIIKSQAKSIGIFIGPEGGFEETEIALLNQNGVQCGTLGKRILRAETAPLAALSIIMYITGNFN